jgi:monoamine oxidase
MPKTPLFGSIMQAMRLAEIAAHNDIPADEVAEWTETEKQKGLNRREFLRRSLQVGAGLAAFALLPSFKFKEETEAKIAIIGAGMAGLHAAYILQKAGISKNVTIYEGSRRTGGRMFTEKLNGNTGTTELGGEFIDRNHEDMRQLAREFGVVELLKSNDNLVEEMFFMDGKQYFQADAVRAFERVRKKIGKDSHACASKLKELDQMSLEAYINGLNTEEWFKKALAVAYIGEYGAELADQSALNLVALVGKQKKRELALFGTSDESIKFLGGNQQLCDRLAEKVKDQIILEMPLTAIQSKGKGFSLQFAGAKKEEYADYVIMTLPFTVLRGIDGVDKLAEMTPGKLQSIRELGAGQNGKFFLDMNKRIWREQGYQGYLYTNKIHTSWDSYHLQNENSGKSIYSVFFGGNVGANISEGGGKAYLDEISTAFPGFKDQFSGYTSQMNWWKYPWSKGSYICPKPGQYSTVVEQAGTPIGNMLFAGEHTSINFGGFMNGAAETGRLAAQELIRRLKG